MFMHHELVHKKKTIHSIGTSLHAYSPIVSCSPNPHFCYSLQLSAVMQDVLQAQGVSVLRERLTFTPRVDDTREIIQQLNVRAVN